MFYSTSILMQYLKLVKTCWLFLTKAQPWLLRNNDAILFKLPPFELLFMWTIVRLNYCTWYHVSIEMNNSSNGIASLSTNQKFLLKKYYENHKLKNVKKLNLLQNGIESLPQTLICQSLDQIIWVWYIKGLLHQVAIVKSFVTLSLWERLN